MVSRKAPSVPGFNCQNVEDLATKAAEFRHLPPEKSGVNADPSDEEGTRDDCERCRQKG